MTDNFDTDTTMNELWEEEESLSGDPFDGLTASEQDLFFRMVDLLPDDVQPFGIEYFMENPRKIRAVVDNIKQKKEIIKTGDKDALAKLLEEESVVIEKIDAMEAGA